MYLSLPTVCLIAALVLFCQAPAGFIKTVLGLLFMHAVCALALAFVVGLIGLPVAVIAFVAGCITPFTAGPLLLALVLALLVPVVVFAIVKEFDAPKGATAPARYPANKAGHHGLALSQVSRKTWMQLGAAAVAFASMCALSATWAVIVALVGVIIWAVLLPPRAAENGA